MASPTAVFAPRLLGLALILLAAGCTIHVPGIPERKDGPPPGPVDVSAIPDAVPRAEPRSRYGNPSSYVVNGNRYHVMASNQGYVERGIASWYGSKFHGRRTSSGEPYDMYAMTAAHKTLPLPTYARVTNLRNGRSVVVKINDRGPFHGNRLIDLSYTAAAKLGILREGTGLVEVAALTPGRQAPPPPRAMKASLKSPDLFIQVGAFSKRYNAERLAERLADSLNRSIRIKRADDGEGGEVFRVQVGPLASVELADTLTDRLAQLGIHGLHVIID